MPHCLTLLRQAVVCALALALASAGKSIAARMAMMAITTSSSIKVKAPEVTRRRRIADVKADIMSFIELPAIPRGYAFRLGEITFSKPAMQHKIRRTILQPKQQQCQGG